MPPPLHRTDSKARQKSHTTPSAPAAGDVVAEELTSKLASLEDRLRKELLGLDNEPPPAKAAAAPSSSSRAAPTTRGPYSTQRGITPSTRGGAQNKTPAAAPAATPAPQPPAATAPRTDVRKALQAMQRHRTDLQHERSALAWLLQTQQRAASEMRHGLESVLKQAAAVQQTESRKHAASLAEANAMARRHAESERAASQVTLRKVQEERGARLLPGPAFRGGAGGFLSSCFWLLFWLFFWCRFRYFGGHF